MSVCRDCGAEIDWVRTEEGRYIPVDPEPVFVIEGEGNECFYDEELGVITGRPARAGGSADQGSENQYAAGLCSALADLQSETVRYGGNHQSGRLPDRLPKLPLSHGARRLYLSGRL